MKTIIIIAVSALLFASCDSPQEATVINHYWLKHQDSQIQKIVMPDDATILSVFASDVQAIIWLVVAENDSIKYGGKETRTFEIFKDGDHMNPLPDNWSRKFIGTVSTKEGIRHVFELDRAGNLDLDRAWRAFEHAIKGVFIVLAFAVLVILLTSVAKINK